MSLATVAVTVTYGNRGECIKRTVRGALAAGVAAVVLVDNGSDSNTQHALMCLAEELGDKVALVRMSHNTGSAGGFAAGIERARELKRGDFIWLLDDDNVAEPKALQRLHDAYRLLGDDSNNVLLSFRQTQQQCIDACTNGSDAAIRPNSFQGFHVSRLAQRVAGYLNKRVSDRAASVPHPLTELAIAVYGGLWFHHHWIDRIGLPDPKFFVYSDDLDFSSRIPREGGHIYLCATSRVDDIDQAWSHRQVRSSPWVSPMTSDFRVYFSLRNQVYFERRYITNGLVYGFNRWLYMSLIALLGLLRDRRLTHLIKRLKLLRRAIRDGDQGRLGDQMPPGYGLH